MTTDCDCDVCVELRQLAEVRSDLLYAPRRVIHNADEARRVRVQIAEQVVRVNRHIRRLEELGCQAPRAEDELPATGRPPGWSGSSSAGGADAASEGRPRAAPSQLMEGVH